MDLEHTAIMRLQEASKLSEFYYQKPLLLAYSGGKDSEAKLTGKGIRLRAGGIEDDMVEVSSSDKSLLRAGNFVQNNGGVLRPLNILSHKYNKLGSISGTQIPVPPHLMNSMGKGI